MVDEAGLASGEGMAATEGPAEAVAGEVDGAAFGPPPQPARRIATVTTTALGGAIVQWVVFTVCLPDDGSSSATQGCRVSPTRPYDPQPTRLTKATPLERAVT